VPELMGKTEISGFNEIQRGIAFDLRHTPSICHYYIAQTILTIYSEIHVASFKKAWEQVINSHPKVFSLIFKIKNEIDQYPVRSSLNVPFFYQDFQCLSPEEQQKQLTSLQAKDFDTPFCLENPPLIRLNLCRLGVMRYVLIWSKHHLLMDGEGSYFTLVSVFSCYFSLRQQGNLQPLSRRDLYHAKYSIDLKEEEMAKVYWQQNLRDFEKCAFLCAPLSQVSPSHYPFILEQSFVIPNDLMVEIKKLVRHGNSTVNSLLQGVLAVVLSIYSGRKKIILGTVRRFPNRKDYGIGLMTNTLPLMIEVNSVLTITEYLAEIVKLNQFLRSLAVLPVRYLKQWCQIPLEQPLYETVIDYKPFSLAEALEDHFPGLHFKSEFHLRIPYPMVFQLTQSKQSLRGVISYDCNRFDCVYIDTIIQSYLRVLEIFLKHPHLKMSNIPSLNGDQERVIQEWGQTKKVTPQFSNLHHYVERWAKEQPQWIALCYREHSMTYAILNKRANQMAYFFIHEGIGLESRIALSFFPCFEQYIALLAVLKCGATIVPIDPTYPLVRIQFILQDVKPIAWIIADTIYENLQSEMLQDNTFRLWTMSYLNQQCQSFPINNLTVKIPVSTAVYIVYTSGSTGQPKGVIVEQRQWIAMMTSCKQCFSMTEKERILQISAFGFDVFQADWALAFMSGATLCLFENYPFSSEGIIRAIKFYSASVITCASAIMSSLPRVSLPHLKKSISGGEPCPRQTLDFWSKEHMFYHVYGITETTIISTSMLYSSGETDLTIGRPIPGVNFYILNELGHCCPVYVPGEIYIGGQGVARGYWNRDQETRKRFITLNLFGKAERVYRTGDMARWLPSGKIEFLSRRDTQVKIRGCRVELAEIEKVLCSYSGVITTSVVITSKNDHPLLYAFVVASESNLTEEILKSYLQEKLPRFMSPHRIIFIDCIPKNPNGKINLPVLVEKANELAYTIEVSEMNSSLKDSIASQIIHQIQTVLSISQVPLDKNFFDLGFDSITLASLVPLLEKTLCIELDVVDLLTYSTVNSLREYIRSKIKCPI